MFLFVQSWDIVRGKEKEYTDFVLGEHLPVFRRIGLNVVGGFHVIVGAGPRISHVVAAGDLRNLQEALETADFLRITGSLQEYIVNYSSRIFRHTDRVKLETYGIGIGTWRFNQHYTLIPGAEEEYGRFLGNEYSAALLDQGIRIKAEWQGLVGSGPYRILLEGVAENIQDIAGTIISDEYRAVKRTLLTRYARQYSSRILAPTGRVEVAFILGEMTRSL